jgi:hypothetical protein
LELVILEKVPATFSLLFQGDGSNCLEKEAGTFSGKQLSF